MKALVILSMLTLISSGCTHPTYTTKHGTWVFNECDDCFFEFPDKEEMEFYLDYLVENSEKCLGAKRRWINEMLRKANLYMVCESFECMLRDGSMATCAGWRRGNKYISIWGGYIWNSPIYHEFGHHIIERMTGSTDPGHTNKWFWEDGLYCLNRPFYEMDNPKSKGDRLMRIIKMWNGDTVGGSFIPPVERTKSRGNGIKIFSTYDLDAVQ